MLAELSFMEQRYQALLAVVQDGWKVVEVARRVGCPGRASMPGSLSTSRAEWPPGGDPD